MATDSQMSVTHNLNGILVPHSTVMIHGKVNPDPDRFAVGFHKDDETILFHLIVRFRNGKGLILNSRNNNVWGNEEIKSDISPFSPGKEFKIGIESLEDSFKVSVDDKHLLTFNARIKPLKDINYINIWGDFEMFRLLVSLK
ncbi:galectin-3-like isoform X1 [Microcaecilia unicolor]|uniref:Galectin n=1 Tax=Microcaecilia unicolor TaxID=1415580 RepID=A0A6P7Z5P9_9AMPH|nr:galectin-3-like isoform X1 [Microcaecilia unicolor]